MAKGQITLPIGFKRVDAEPLEVNVLFTSLEAAQSYASTDPTSYAGQALYVANSDDQTVKAYLVNFEKSLINIGEVPEVDLDWANITNKPQINGHDLVAGNNTLESLGIQAAGDYITESEINQKVEDAITGAQGVQDAIDNRIDQKATEGDWQSGSEVTSAIQSAISTLGTLLTLKGRKDQYSELASVDSPKAGDVWLVGLAEAPELEEYVYTAEGKWEKLGVTTQVDLSDYVTTETLTSTLADYVKTSDADSKYATKADGITSEERQKIAVIQTDGTGQKVLSDAGTYIDLPTPETGVSDYSQLTGKPQINGNELATGNQTSADLGIDCSTTNLKAAIEVTGVTVGNITDGTTLQAGTSIESILNQILRKRIAATYTQPTLSLTGTGTTPVECGTQQNITLTQTFTKNDAGDATGYVLKQGADELQSDATGEPYELQNFTVPEGTTTFTSTVTYGQGPVKNDNFGEESPTGRIEAGSKTASKAYIGQRNAFYGTNTSDIAVATSANIRALSGKKLNPQKGNSVAISIAQGTMCVVFALPTSIGAITSIVQTATGYDIKDSFVKTTVEVEGANSYTAVSYDVYKYAPAAPLNADTFTVNI